MNHGKTYISWVFVVLFTAVSCKLQRAPRSGARNLSGRDWVVIEDGQPVISNGKRIYIRFLLNKFQGYAGCNTLFGSYIAQGGNLSFAGVSHTQVKCADMDSEHALLDLLPKVNRFRIQGDEVHLYSGKILLLELRQRPVH